jgi:circadian clock protein KaiC
MADEEPSCRPAPRVTTGIGGLDAMLDGGLLAGGMYVVVGTPGAGKTIFANQLAFHHAAHGHRVAYFTVFGETHTRLLSHIGQFSFFRHKAVGTSIHYLSGYNEVLTEGIGALRHLLHHHVQAHAVSLLIVDGLPLELPQPSTSITAIYDFFHRLQALCEVTACTAVIMIPSTGHIWDHLAFLFVDGVVELARTVQPEVVLRTLEIRKFRGSLHRASAHPFTIATDGLTMLP